MPTKKLSTAPKPVKPRAKKAEAAAPKTARKPRAKKAPVATSQMAATQQAGVEPLAAETAAYGKREDRQLGNTNYNRPFQSDRHASATYGPPPQDLVGSTGPTAGVSVATKVLTLTLGAGTQTPAVAGATLSYLVDWGDGLSDTYTSAGAKTHTYATAGTWAGKVTQTVLSSAGKGIGGGTVAFSATTT